MGILDFFKKIFKKEDLQKPPQKIKPIQEFSKLIENNEIESLIKIACKKANMLSYYQDILNLVKPSTLLLTEKDNFIDKEMGSSKFGGSPDLPKNFIWPKVGTLPLSFILQINCEDLPDYATEYLPKKGLLSFFFCFDSQLACSHPSNNEYGKIYHFEVDVLTRTPAPKHINIYEIQPCRIRFLNFPSLPYCYDYYSEKLWGFDFLKREEDLDDGYIEVCDALEELYGINGKNYHQLFGYPQSVQGTNIEFVISQAKNGRNKKFEDLSENEFFKIYKQKLILQIQEIDDIGFQLIDCGKIYFMVENNEKFSPKEVWTMLDFG
jgi:uncharacterized protein YwqG